MFERYQADPTSVPAEWITHFQNNPQAGTPTAPVAGAPKGGTPPTPKTVTPPNISMAGTTPVAPTPAAPVVVTEPAQKISKKSSGITVEEFNDQMDISIAQLESVAVMAETLAMIQAAEEGTN